jgi:hypothetical protein
MATTHDSKCEQLPGGAYFGRTIGNPAMPIPCHCEARAAGRKRAEREMIREAARAATAADVIDRISDMQDSDVLDLYLRTSKNGPLEVRQAARREILSRMAAAK